MALITGKTQYGSGSRFADPRQSQDTLKLIREHTVIFLQNDLGCAVQVTGPGVIPQPGPVTQHGVDPGSGQRHHIRKATNKALIEWNDGCHLGLLQHDF